MTLVELNQLDVHAAFDVLARCCAAHRWAQGMVAARPFASVAQMLDLAGQIWLRMSEDDLLEAFGAHPQIGNVDSLRAKYAGTKILAAGEQSAVAFASDDTLQALAECNRAYLNKFGFVFIVCATGKSASEMLALLQARLLNRREQELINAAEEQQKITAIRLHKLLGDG